MRILQVAQAELTSTFSPAFVPVSASKFSGMGEWQILPVHKVMIRKGMVIETVYRRLPQRRGSTLKPKFRSPAL